MMYACIANAIYETLNLTVRCNKNDRNAVANKAGLIPKTNFPVRKTSQTGALRVTILATNGCRSSGIDEVRCYPD
jgi:hypothetical protein